MTTKLGKRYRAEMADPVECEGNTTARETESTGVPVETSVEKVLKLMIEDRKQREQEIAKERVW